MKNYDDHWRIAYATPGRAVLIPLPPSLTEDQAAWLRDNVPRSCRITPPHEPVSNLPRFEDQDNQIDSLRALTTQVTEKKLELLRIEQELSKVKLELEREKFILEERKKHARSFGSAITELVEQLGGKLKI